MKPSIIIFLFFIMSSWLHGQDLANINATYTREPLVKVIQDLEQRYGLNFSFDNTNVEGIFIYANINNASLEKAMDIVFSRENLTFEIIDEKYIIIKKIDKTIEGTLCGIIVDQITGNPLPFANVFVQNTNKGTNSDENGAFQLKGNFSKEAMLEISYLGYNKQILPIVDLLSSPCKTIALIYQELTISGVIISEYLTDGIGQSEKDNHLLIRPGKMTILPGQTEPDILQSIQLLPGVSSPDESASGIYIRGGTPDQNLVLYDGVPVYHTGHFFGMISAFNPYIVDNVKVYRSGFGPQYGGRVSGIIDINSTQNIPENIDGGAGLNLTHAHFYTKIPFLHKKMGLVLSARRSFTDVVQSPTFNKLADRIFQGTKIGDAQNAVADEEPLELEQVFYFNDFNAKWLYEPTKTDKISIGFLRGNNILNYENNNLESSTIIEDKLDLKNTGGHIQWKKEWTDKWSTAFTGAHSNFEYEYDYLSRKDTSEIPLDIADKENSVKDTRFTANINWQYSDQHALRWGYELRHQNIRIKILSQSRFEEDFEELSIRKANTHALFTEYNYVKDKFFLKTGLRYNYYTGTKNYYIEPRIYSHFQLTPAFKTKASFGIHHQFISQLLELDFNDLGINNQIWQMAFDGEEDASIIQSTQWTLGGIFKKNNWQIDVEAYYKKLDGITSLSVNFTTLPNDLYSRGKADIKGLDILVKKRWDNYRTWLSYSMGKISHEFLEISEQSFPASYDQRHILRWAHIYNWKNWTFSLAWNYSSGKPFTEVEDDELIESYDEEVDENFYVADPESINSERLPKYHRMDFSMLYRIVQKQEKWKASLSLSILNLYNRKNILNRQSFLEAAEDSEEEVPDIQTYDRLLLRFMPNLAVRVEW